MKTIAELSVDARLLAQKLRDVGEGDLISYEALSGIIKRNVAGKARGLLYTAIRIVQRDHSMVFETVRGEGLKRLPNGHIPTVVGTHTRRRLHNTAKRGVRKIGCTNYDTLTKVEQNQYNAEMSTLGVLTMISGQKAFTQVQKCVSEVQSLLPNADTLALFAK